MEMEGQIRLASAWGITVRQVQVYREQEGPGKEAAGTLEPRPMSGHSLKRRRSRKRKTPRPPPAEPKPLHHAGAGGPPLTP